jgi:hypothetical protein
VGFVPGEGFDCLAELFSGGNGAIEIAHGGVEVVPEGVGAEPGERGTLVTWAEKTREESIWWKLQLNVTYWSYSHPHRFSLLLSWPVFCEMVRRNEEVKKYVSCLMYIFQLPSRTCN